MMGITIIGFLEIDAFHSGRVAVFDRSDGTRIDYNLADLLRVIMAKPGTVEEIEILRIGLRDLINNP